MTTTRIVPRTLIFLGTHTKYKTGKNKQLEKLAMMPMYSSQQRKLSMSLHQSLQGLMTDKVFENSWNIQVPNDNERSLLRCPSHVARDALHANIPHATPDQFLFPKASIVPSEPVGLTSEKLILAAAAAERKMLEHARAASIRQQAFLEMKAQQHLYSESFLTSCLMKMHGNAIKAKSSWQPIVDQMIDARRKDFQGTLEALGHSFRNKDSPYVDASALPDPDLYKSSEKKARGGVTEPFPEKLHRMLQEVEEAGNSDVISFFAHGRAFGVHDPDRFMSEIMPKYFQLSKFCSFQRQLHLYGFTRITSGPDAGGYYHELFLKGRPGLCLHMRRVRVPKGERSGKFRGVNVSNEPDFYAMAFVGNTST